MIFSQLITTGIYRKGSVGGLNSKGFSNFPFFMQILINIRSIFNAVILLTAFIPIVHSQGQEITKAEMLEDLIRLEQQLLQFHPAIQSGPAKQSIESLTKQIRTALPDNWNTTPFFHTISEIIDIIDCSHTVIYPRKMKSKDLKGIFPIRLQIIGGKVVLKEDYEIIDSSLKKGSQLLSINGAHIDTIITKLTSFHGGTDFPNPMIERQLTVQLFQLRYLYLYGGGPSFDIEIQENSHSEPRIIKIEGKNIKSFKGKSSTIELRQDSISRAGILNIKSFSAYDAFQIIYGSKIKKAFRELEELGLQDLIIDLRNNLGGAYINQKRLLQYLIAEEFSISKQVRIKKSAARNLGLLQKIVLLFQKKEKEGDWVILNRFNRKIKPSKRYQFNGELMLLINHTSLSASSIVSAILKSEQRATLVGTTSGGGFHKTYGGYFKVIRLKNSGFRITIPMMEFQHQVKPGIQEPNTLLKPHVSSSIDLESFRLNVDQQLEKALELLEEDN